MCGCAAPLTMQKGQNVDIAKHKSDLADINERIKWLILRVKNVRFQVNF
jgi:hypothetical protein